MTFGSGGRRSIQLSYARNGATSMPAAPTERCPVWGSGDRSLGRSLVTGLWSLVTDKPQRPET